VFRPEIHFATGFSAATASTISRASSFDRLRREKQRLAVGEHSLQDTPKWLAILDWFQSDGNFIPRLEGLPTPAIVGHGYGILSLPDPMYHLAVITLDVELKEAMGIGPVPFRDGSLQSEFFSGIERRVAVVREQRNGDNQKTNSHGEHRDSSLSHCNCLHARKYHSWDP
jgi:hypothetical protein